MGGGGWDGLGGGDKLPLNREGRDKIGLRFTEISSTWLLGCSFGRGRERGREGTAESHSNLEDEEKKRKKRKKTYERNKQERQERASAISISGRSAQAPRSLRRPSRHPCERLIARATSTPAAFARSYLPKHIHLDYVIRAPKRLPPPSPSH